MLIEKLKEISPLGFHFPAQDIDVDGLHTLIDYPAEQVFMATIDRTKRLDAYHEDLLQTELHVRPENYHLIEPDTQALLASLDDIEKAVMADPLLALVEDTDQMLENKLLQKYPNLFGAQVVIDLKKSKRMMQCLYVENVGMPKVTQILLQHPHISTLALKETLQLFDLLERGVKVIESGKKLSPRVAEHVGQVTADLQHMYTGEGKPLESHPYYQKDIRLIYDRELKAMAELHLRERKMIPTRLQSFQVIWANANGDGWECRSMTEIINDRFKSSYRGKLAEAFQPTPDSPNMRLDIYTDKPRWRKDVLDTVKKSWALQHISEITDRGEMAEEIESWNNQNDAGKKLNLHFSGINETLYAFENGTDGLLMIDRGRHVQQFGEQLSERNKKILEQLVKHENLLTADGSLFMQPVGPRHEFIEKSTGKKVVAFQETVNGQPMMVAPYKYLPSLVHKNPHNYVDITGRLTDAQVIGQGYSSAIRCKIDGEQIPAIRMSYSDAQQFKNGVYTAEQLAVKYFAWQLLKDQLQEQDQDRGIKR